MIIPQEDLLRLDKLIQLDGRREFAQFLAKNAPRDQAEFVAQLHEDLRDCLRSLEKIADGLQEEEEEQLRDRVLSFLVARGYQASAEEKVRGRTDLLVKSNWTKTSWIGEAKKHSGYDQLKEGIRQLHTRYSNGRETQVGFVIFLFGENAKLVVGRWKHEIATDNLCGFIAPVADVPGDPFDFNSKHIHVGSGTELTTTHFFALLHYDPKDKSALASAAKSA